MQSWELDYLNGPVLYAWVSISSSSLSLGLLVVYLSPGLLFFFFCFSCDFSDIPIFPLPIRSAWRLHSYPEQFVCFLTFASLQKSGQIFRWIHKVYIQPNERRIVRVTLEGLVAVVNCVTCSAPVSGSNPLCVRLSPPRCLTCSWACRVSSGPWGIIVVRASWPGHPTLIKKKKKRIARARF